MSSGMAAAAWLYFLCGLSVSSAGILAFPSVAVARPTSADDATQVRDNLLRTGLHTLISITVLESVRVEVRLMGAQIQLPRRSSVAMRIACGLIAMFGTLRNFFPEVGGHPSLTPQR